MCATNRVQRYKKNLKYANPYIIFLHIWKKSSNFGTPLPKIVYIAPSRVTVSPINGDT